MCALVLQSLLTCVKNSCLVQIQFYNPECFNGVNIGLFINQSGLLEGLRALGHWLQLSNQRPLDHYAPGDICCAFECERNVDYWVNSCGHLEVIFRNTLCSTDDVQKLYKNYTLTLWVKVAEAV